MTKVLSAFTGVLPFRRTRLVALAFLGLLLATAIPVLSVDIPPLADYANHLARMHVIAALDHNPHLAALYRIDWAPLPNLAMDAIVPPLIPLLGLYGAGKAFVLLTILLLTTGPVALQRALHGRADALSLSGFLFVFNGILLLGLVNYLFGAGLAMWGVAAAAALRRRPAWQQGLVSAAFVLILFFCHLFALGVYGLGLLALHVFRWLAEDRRLGWRDHLAFVLPFGVALPLMSASPTHQLSRDILWDAHGKAEGLFYIVSSYNDLVDFGLAAVVVAAVTYAGRRRLLSLHAAGWTLLTIGCLVFIAMPRMLFGSWMADQRLPVALVFLLIGFARLDTPRRRLHLAAYGLLAALVLGRGLVITSHWAELNATTEEMRGAMRLMEPGSALLVAHADQSDLSTSVKNAVSHMPNLAVIERSALVSTVFTVAGKQVMTVNAPYRGLVDAEDGDPPTLSQLLADLSGLAPGPAAYWTGWAGRYDYLVLLNTDSTPPDLVPEVLTPVFYGNLFALYRITPVPGD